MKGEAAKFWSRKPRKANRWQTKAPKRPGWIPPHLSEGEAYKLQVRERGAVKAADRAIDDAQHRDREGYLAIPDEERLRMRSAALSAARAAAREDFRRQALAEIAEAAKEKADLPAHISRIARGSVTGFIEVAPDIALIETGLIRRDQ